MAKSVCIADVCKEIFAGGDVPKSALSYEKTAEYNVPIFSNGEKNCGLYGYTNNARVKEPSITVSARGTIGYTAIRTEPFVPVVRLITLTPKSEVIDLDYLFYATQNYKFEGSGTSIPQLTVPMLKKYKFPLPEMSHQKAIAVKFEKLDQLISLRKQQLAKLDELVKARFLEMFGDFKSNSKGWSIVKFDDFAKIDGNMTTDYKKYADYPHIGIDSIEKGTGALKGYRTVKEDGVVSGKYIFTPQHIIYSKIRPNLNKVALPDFEGLCSADAYPILPNPKNCNRIFLALAMRSDYFLDYILQFSARTNLPKVNRKEIAGFSMPLPPLSLQNDFSTFVERVDQQKQTVQQSLEKLELMKKALMQEYFG